jgi:UDP-N-acetylglucosamine 4,6-dehydratase/5-epimerase
MKDLLDKNKNILIFGGSGFLGKQLLTTLSENGHDKVTLFSRDEGKLIELKQRFPAVQIITGDVSDKFEVYQAMKGKDYIFHLAAFKHVGLAEKYSRECIKSNLVGSLNILECSIETRPELLITTSTDKAAQVNGVYGAKKFLVEELFKQFEKVNSETKYRVVRYGNVLYSTGSVLCKWKKLIQQGKEVIITDPTATRFFWTVSEAVSLLFECLRVAEDASPYCPEMKSMAMGDLLTAMINKYAGESDIPVKTIGLQQGENKHEKILRGGPSSDEVEKFTVKQIMELI